MKKDELTKFFTACGIDTEPLGWYFTDEQPGRSGRAKEYLTPKTDNISWTCILQLLVKAREKKKTAYFEAQHYGCPGGAYHMGFTRPISERTVYFVSTGEPGGREPELYLSSPETARKYFTTLDKYTAPKQHLVFKPISFFDSSHNPEYVIFFGKPDVISGLHQLVTFVTDEMEAVHSPWGSGCANIITWPQYYKDHNKIPAVLGGWDPSCRVFLPHDEILLTVSFEIYKNMVEKYEQSFINTHAWSQVLKRIRKK
jgi:uncharacterized protein (DUF169 family)